MLIFIELHSVPRIVLALNHELFYLTSTVPATATPLPPTNTAANNIVCSATLCIS